MTNDEISELKAVNAELKAVNTELKAENLRLQKKIFRLEAKVVAAQNGVIAEIDGKPLSELTISQLDYLILEGEKRLQELKCR